MRLLALAPIVHLSFCYVYLYFLHLGFGGGVGKFLEPTDVFRVVMGDVITAYIPCVAGGVLGFLTMDSDPTKIKGRTDYEMHASLRKSRFLKFSFIFLFIAIPISQIFSIIYFRSVSIFAFMAPLIALIGWFLVKVFDKNQFNHVFRIPIALYITSLIILSVNGYTNGFWDRNKPYDYFRESPTFCNAGKLLLVLNAMNIVVDERGRRKGYSQDCNLMVEFPRNEVAINISL